MQHNPQNSEWLDTPDENGVLFAYALDGKGGGTALHSATMSEELRNEGLAWVHLNREHPGTRAWLQREVSYLDPLILDALLAYETRPRVVEFDQGLLVILRGANLNEGADPDDMVAVRLWIDPLRIITLRRRRLSSIRDISDKVRAGRGPKNAGDFLWMLCDRMFERMEPVFDDLEDTIDMLEETVLDKPEENLGEHLIEVRKRAIMLRRYIAPQKDVVTQLRLSGQKWISTIHRRHLQESYEQLARYVEELDSVRERAQVVKDELASAMSGKLNRHTYVLSVIAAIFIPLTFLTGLLGINVNGIPGAAHENAFWIFTCVLCAVVALQIVLFKWLRWF